MSVISNYNSATPNPIVTIYVCSWKGCGVCLMCKAEAAGRRAVDQYGDALRRLAD